MSDQPTEQPPHGRPQHPPARPPGYPEAYPPPGYPPAAGYPVPAPTRTNGMAIASLVFGILWLFGIGSILAIVFGSIAKSQIDQSGGTERGRGMAIAGIVLGAIGAAFFLLFFAFGFGVGGGGGIEDDLTW